MFSLNGTIQPVTPGQVPAPFGGSGRAGASEPTRPADIDNGEQIYREACLPCHGSSGDGGEGGGASLLNGMTVETAAAVTSNGRNNMPSFGEAYSVDELYDVATFIVERLAAE
jgi:mono/diheme cytochrome c family protein